MLPLVFDSGGVRAWGMLGEGRPLGLTGTAATPAAEQTVCTVELRRTAARGTTAAAAAMVAAAAVTAAAVTAAVETMEEGATEEEVE